MSSSAWSKGTLAVSGRSYAIRRLSAVEEAGLGRLSRLPRSIRVLLENLLRYEDGRSVTREDIAAVASWKPNDPGRREIAFRPARVLLQDLTGVPAVVDLAALRDAMASLGADPAKINPLRPADLVIDHSVHVDLAGSALALDRNRKLEYERNGERYQFLRWGQEAFRNFRVVPPGAGIVHQVNLEYLAPVVFDEEQSGERWAFPDTVVGTDSHTTMINGAGVVGWGVGGIEAEACLLGQPVSMLIPDVVGFRLTGKLPAGATATDLVLRVVQMLRKHGVVDKFVEFFGSGLASLSLADRATVANMAPEYGATIGFFPIDEQVIEYLKLSGREPSHIALVEAYARTQGIFATVSDPDPEFTSLLELDLADVGPSLAGPSRPQDRVSLHEVASGFEKELPKLWKGQGSFDKAAREKKVSVEVDGQRFEIGQGSVIIAAITSCTNTSNPSVMLAAGLLAKKAIELGLKTQPWVKASLAPGSQVVRDYLAESGVLTFLEQLRFNVVGFGCTTCIGNSGPIPEAIEQAIVREGLVACSVLSGNRNFEGRVHAAARANYLASPPLVVAYALAGRIDIDLTTQPIGTGKNGKPVFLKDIWPDPIELQRVIQSSVKAEQFRLRYSQVFDGDAEWKAVEVPRSDRFAWSAKSSYVRKPPFLDGLKRQPTAPTDIKGARVLALLGDSVTTDHISPAGDIPASTPAGKFLVELGIKKADFNSYGSRRGNYEVMVRGTFANTRLKNKLAPGTEGGFTTIVPDGTATTIYEASLVYAKRNVPLLIIAGREYGTGSSRDWAAKGPLLLGVRAVLAESLERIHRSNLIGMGILPLEFTGGQNAASLGLTGQETYDVLGVENVRPGGELTVRVTPDSGAAKDVRVRVRIDTPDELAYYQNGGILPYVLRQLLAK